MMALVIENIYLTFAFSKNISFLYLELFGSLLVLLSDGLEFTASLHRLYIV